MPKLSKRQVETIKEAGFYGDGEGLYLSVKRSGSKSWILRTMVQGRRRDIGLGSTQFVSLAEARNQAREYRKIAREGGDPLASEVEELTFAEAAHSYHRIIAPSFTSGKHASLWLSGLSRHVFPQMGSMLVSEVTVTDVRKVLEPIWYDKHETARKIKQRMEVVFDWARAEGYRTSENPCAGVKRALKPVRRNPAHHPAMPWQEVPQFYQRLCEREAMSALALRFIILTACRSGEVRGAQWSEIKEHTWVVPASRTKTRSPHRVPLTTEAKSILDTVKGLDPKLVFPSRFNDGQRGIGQLSINAFRPLYDRMEISGITTHGFRSSFRDWCSEMAEAPRELAEAALGHTVGQVERAYRRTDLYERRVVLMESWATYAVSAR